LLPQNKNKYSKDSYDKYESYYPEHEKYAEISQYKYGGDAYKVGVAPGVRGLHAFAPYNKGSCWQPQHNEIDLES
jgi:hypothetical protein